MVQKAFVLLSGGIDSTTCLYLARHDFEDVEGVSIFYNQRHRTEIIHAQMSCDDLGIKHNILNLSSVVPKTMLTDPDVPLPNKSYADIAGVSPTYVPFRNGLMLSAIAAYIQGQMPKTMIEEWAVYFGAHAEDARNWAYPDCTPEFTGAMANAIYIGTYSRLRLHVPLQWMGKAGIIKLGSELGVIWEHTWSCYGGGEAHCGTCPTCRARREGFLMAGVPDPTEYEKPILAQK